MACARGARSDGDGGGERRREGRRALAAAGLSLAELKEILRAEEAARLSEATQAMYREAERRDDTDWLEVTDGLQRSLLTAAGVPDARVPSALYALRCAAQLFPDDPELRTIPLYVRNNRARAGSLQPGDHPPDVPLFALADGSDAAATTPLAACAEVPTLLVAGSFT